MFLVILTLFWYQDSTKLYAILLRILLTVFIGKRWGLVGMKPDLQRGDRLLESGYQRVKSEFY